MIEFAEQFGAAQVGILTGDRKENPGALIIGYDRILRISFTMPGPRESLATDLVVLDEADYLGDEDRGVVWKRR